MSEENKASSEEILNKKVVFEIYLSHCSFEYIILLRILTCSAVSSGIYAYPIY